MFSYRPLIEINKFPFFNKVSNTHNKTANKYDKVLVTSDLNIDFCNSKMDTNNYLSDFIDSFSLTNMVNSTTCFKTFNGTLRDIVFNKSFCKPYTIEFSDFHKMIVTFLRVSFKRIPSKILFLEIKNYLTKMNFFMKLI